ncbi:MAG: imidazoleglycerol-phosphate dehydratase [Candidatus Calescibacterium sp.]|nr:imidazoleglycerol-phosphate dehydratase [Candidatus Calescibacterium sp.]
MSGRVSSIEKKTKEVEVRISVNIDGKGERKISTSIGFLDHMLEIFSEFSLFDIEVEAKGDTNVDYHHLTEEIGICFGKAIREACGDDIERFADAKVPLDEALCEFVLDISGRPYFFIHNFNLIRESYYANILHVFFDGVARGGGFTQHCIINYGMNSHHIVEACFKAAALCFRRATRKRDLNKPSSTKGYIF